MKVRELSFRIRVLVEPDGDSFHAYCPDLKGLHVCGDSEREALEAAREAVGLYMMSLLNHGAAIPVGLVDRDEMHPSFWSYIGCKIKDKLTGRHPKEFVEDISVADCAAA